MSNLEHISPIVKRTLKQVRKYTMRPREDAEQQTVIDWARKYGRGAEQIHMMPNGSCFRRDDFRLWNWLMSMGFEPGKPDLYLDIARGRYHGLRIEMKPVDYKESTIDPKVLKFHLAGMSATHIAEALGKSKSRIYAQLHQLRQHECQQRLRDQGFLVVECHGAATAIEIIREYLR